jgi:hypothetical protein
MSPPRRRSLLWALVRQRCPRCRDGRMFAGSFRMNDPCPVCGRLFQREEGFFLGAMYFSYALATAVLVPIFLLVTLLLPGQHSVIIVLVSALCYFPFVPVIFRYSRVLWVYVDELVSPGESSDAAYEKVRKQQIEKGQVMTKEK